MTTPHGPKISADTYGMSQRTGRAAKKLPAQVKAVRREIATVRAARRARQYSNVDKLAYRSRDTLLRELAVQRLMRANDTERATDEAKRRTLIAAARAARSCGYAVRSSSGRDGTVSSYYVDTGAVRFRISDHEIPTTAHRESVSLVCNGRSFDGYHGPQLIIDRARSRTWLRRAIILAAHGRSV